MVSYVSNFIRCHSLFHILVVYNSSVVIEGEGSMVDVGHSWVPIHLLLNVQHRHLTGKRAVTLATGTNNHGARGKVYSDECAT